MEKNARDTLLLYTSDHGVFLESRRLTDEGPAVYDEITRIPFLCPLEGPCSRKRCSASPISHIDSVPTIMDFFGFEIPETEGGSVLSQFTDPNAKLNREVFIEWGRYEVDHDGFVRLATHPLYLQWAIQARYQPDDFRRLYDLQAEPVGDD